MSFTLFADESGTAPPAPCYSIGVLTVPIQEVDRFDAEFARLRLAHGVVGEIRWAKVSTSHGLMNCVLDLMKYVLRSELSFNSITVLKGKYNKWQRGPIDVAFYTTYGLLMKQCAKGRPGDYTVFIDQRNERYPRHDEAMQVITNHMLRQIATKAKLASVTKADSKHFPGIQTADVITGAINAAHYLYLDSSCPLAPGKRLLLRRLAAVLGWDALHYDTYPNDDFNVWHFPQDEYRAVPAGRVNGFETT